MRFISTALLAAFLAASAFAQPAVPTAEVAFADAYALFDARLFGEAERAFADFRTAYPDDPRTPDALYYGGESALATGDDERAAFLLAAFRTRYPNHPLAPRARLALGEYYFATEQYDRALDALSEALSEDQPPEDAARALLLMGQTSLRQDRPDAALVYLRRVAAEYPNAVAAAPALYAAGFAEYERANYAPAANDFERIATRYARSPEDLHVGLALTDSYLQTGQYSKAIEEGERRLPDLTGATRDRALFLLGESALRLARHDEAESYFAQIDATGPYGRRSHFGLGRIAFEQENWTAAADHFATVRTAQEETVDLGAEATYYESLSLKRLNQIDEAARRLEAVHVRRPSSSFADAALFERGFLLYGVRRWDEAALSFEKLLDRYGTSPFAGEAARMLGETYAALGDYQKAQRANERAERLGTASSELSGEVAFQQGYTLYQNAQYAEAARRLQKIYSQNPRAPRAGETLFWAAEASFQAAQAGDAGAFDQAARLFNDFLQRFPDHRQQDAARYALAWTHFKRGDYATAASAFERFLGSYRPGGEIVPYTNDARLRLADSYFALKRFDQAITTYERVEGGGADYARFQVGQALANLGRDDEAIAAYNQLVADFPESPLRPQALFAKGAIYFQQNDYARAIAEYQSVIDGFPGSPLAPKAQYGIGDALYNQGKLSEATAAYRAVLDRYPDSPFVVDALSGVQFALTAQGEEHQLDEVVRQYADQNPDASVLGDLRFRQAEGKYQSGNLRESIADFQQFIRSGGDASLLAAANLYIGRAYVERGEPGQAETYLRRVIDRYPNATVRPEAASRLGTLYLDAERYDEALTLFRSLGDEAATTEAGADARLGEAEALLGLGRAADAEMIFGSVVKEVPGTPTAARATLGLARSYEATGRFDAAIDFYEEVVANDDETGAEALVHLVNAHIQRGDIGGAVSALDRLEADTRFAGYPDQVAESLLLVARAYRDAGESGRADETYQLVIDAYSETPAAAAARSER